MYPKVADLFIVSATPSSGDARGATRAIQAQGESTVQQGLRDSQHSPHENYSIFITRSTING